MKTVTTKSAHPRIGFPWLLFAAFAAVAVWASLTFPQIDVADYAQYARDFLQPPLGHLWPPEYPFLSVGVFLLPWLLPFSYRLSFALLTVGALAFLLRIGFRRWGRPWVVRTVGYLLLGSLFLFAQRYDIFAATAAFFSVLAARRGRYGAAWVGSFIGVWLKLFPVVLWPLLLLEEKRRTGSWRFDRLVWAVLGSIGVEGVQWLLAPQAVFSAFRYLAARPEEVGSLAADIAYYWSDPHFVTIYGSVNIVSVQAAVLSDILLAGGMLAGLWILWQMGMGRLSLCQAAVLALSAEILSSKVFSAQYIIWLIPFWAREKWDGRLLLAGILTTIGYPFLYLSTQSMAWVPAVFGLRDLLLIWWTVAAAKRFVASSGIQASADPPRAAWTGKTPSI
ncbi:MAG: hypothetical protein OWS74_07430 [Firmicutes bacterium]|nr:hypothetical protein [Bacillota bacterium]